jgi:hypothetical protein
MTRKRMFGPYRQDTVAQPFRNKDLAFICADLLERLTGDPCDVIPRARSWYFVVRYVGERWIRA